MLGFVMRDAGAHAGFMKTHTLAGASGWPDVPYAFDMAKQAVDTVFEALYPEGEREAPWGGKISSGPDFGELNKVLGNGFATGLRTPSPVTSARPSKSIWRRRSATG